jgi:predicted transposase/invertase (TIGR01784 family)
MLAKRARNEEYAIATTDTGFKQIFSISDADDTDIVISLLNNFIPVFYGKPVQEVKVAPTALPALHRPGDKRKQTFMDLHVVSSDNVHYIVEMQARRHVMFDERAMFYACSTYSRQLSEDVMKRESWYCKLKPVISLQILDYDSNRIQGETEGSARDSLVARVRKSPMQENQFTKHYTFADKTSGQIIEHLQLIQVEIPRARKDLFPPNADWTTAEWWLSIFRHSHDYTESEIEKCKSFIPSVIAKALSRLKLGTWSSELQAEYRSELIDREQYISVLATERAEGKAEGIAEGRAMAAKAMIDIGKLGREVAINTLQLTAEEIGILDSLQ